MSATNSDRIEKNVLLRVPRSRAWRALTNAAELGSWFRVNLEGGFAVGERVTGKVTYPGHEHLTMELTVERMEPEHFFSFRWPVDPTLGALTTLVEFRLDEVPGGTLLTVVESGFDRVPLARRAELYRGNDAGWATQMENVRLHVEGESTESLERL